MSKVTEKNTKAQILDAYEAAMKTIETLKAGKTSTAEVVKAKEVKVIKETAKAVVEMNILDASIVEKYNNLLKTIEMLEAEIEELYEIKRAADSLEALMNANIDEERKFKIAKQERLDAAEAEYAEKKANHNKEVAQMQADSNKLIAELKLLYNEEKEALKKERKREIEEYTYNLKRERAIEDDKWEDSKAAREAELAKKEEAVEARELLIEQKDNEIVSLKAELDTVKHQATIQIETAFENGKAKAKKDAEIAKGYSDRNHKSEIERKDDRIAVLEQANSKLESQVAELQAKLDAASTRVQEMALKVAENSGVRMVETSSK